MKTLKTISSTVLVLIYISSCNQEESIPQEELNLLGYWQLSDTEFLSEDFDTFCEEQAMNCEQPLDFQPFTYELLADSTYNLYESDSITSSGSWKTFRKRDSITFTANNGYTLAYKIISLDQSNLQLSYQDTIYMTPDGFDVFEIKFNMNLYFKRRN